MGMMKRWLYLPLAVLLTLVFGVSALNAQNNPTIGEIQANKEAYIDDILTLSGTVTAIDQNEWLLNDGTGQIKVDAGPPWYQLISIPSGTAVTITGQVDYEGPPDQRTGNVDFDACRIVTPTQTFEIRDCSFQGPPPWAGGPNGGGRPGR